MNDTVLLIQPLGTLSQPSGYMRTCYLEPIGLEYLVAALEAAGHAVEIMSGQISEEKLASRVTRTCPDVVGFSVHSYMAQHSLRLAMAAKEAARQKGYDLVTVFGGPHPTACPKDVAKDRAVDFVVIGEGEATLVGLLATLAKDGDPARVAGLAFDRKDGVFLTERRGRIRELDELPWPKRSHQFLDIAKQYQIAYPPPGRQVRIAQVMYSRGCPFSCSFCSSENTWGREVVWRPPQAVLDEIESLVQEFGTNLVYFPDLTFNVDKGRVLALCEEFRKRQPPVHWWALFRADLLDAELLGSLRSAGCVKISVGLESLNPDLATSIKGAYAARQAQIRGNLEEADRLGFIIKAFLIIGFPEETAEAIAAYRDRLFDFPIDELRVTFATPFPGTRFFDECRAKGLVERNPDWSKFTTEVPIIRHPSMTDDEIVALREELVTSFYLDQRYAYHVGSKLEKFTHLRASWVEYFKFLDGKGVFAKKQEGLIALLDYLESASTQELSAAEEVAVTKSNSFSSGKISDDESTSG